MLYHQSQVHLYWICSIQQRWCRLYDLGVSQEFVATKNYSMFTVCVTQGVNGSMVSYTWWGTSTQSSMALAPYGIKATKAVRLTKKKAKKKKEKKETACWRAMCMESETDFCTFFLFSFSGQGEGIRVDDDER
jgi:hypothetical protein